MNKEYTKGHGDWIKCGCGLCYHTWVAESVGKLAESIQRSILFQEKLKQKTYLEELFNL